MMPLEIFFRDLYDYIRWYIGEDTVINERIRIKSWTAYKCCIQKDDYRFYRAIKSLAFEVLKTHDTDCFSYKTSIDEDEESAVWNNFSYHDYEKLYLKLYGLYCNRFDGQYILS
jgi:hypothetical protein